MRLGRGTVGLCVAVLLAAGAGCRKSPSLPEVEGAKTTVPFSDVRLFVETPVSSREFESAERRWTRPTSPRFEAGGLRSRPDGDGGVIFVEAPPKAAFRNRGDDCGPSSERRICPLPWEKAEITICGRPLDGHLDIPTDRLEDAGIIVCRRIRDPREAEDGQYEYAVRDCTQAPRIPLRTVDPRDLTFRIGEVGLVSDPGADVDREVCARIAESFDRGAGAGGGEESR